jgi:hypothetical protein
MKQFKHLNIIESWDELKLGQLIEFLKLERTKKSEMNDYEQTLYFIRVIEILCDVNPGDIDDVELDDLNEIITFVGPLLKEVPDYNTSKIEDHLTIEGKLYGVKDIVNNKLTTAEMVSIQQIRMMKDELESFPYLMAIICRPAVEERDLETGNIEYKMERFDSKNFEWRSKLMLKAPGFKCLGILNFFLSGR